MEKVRQERVKVHAGSEAGEAEAQSYLGLLVALNDRTYSSSPNVNIQGQGKSDATRRPEKNFCDSSRDGRAETSTELQLELDPGCALNLGACSFRICDMLQLWRRYLIKDSTGVGHSTGDLTDGCRIHPCLSYPPTPPVLMITALNNKWNKSHWGRSEACLVHAGLGRQAAGAVGSGIVLCTWM